MAGVIVALDEPTLRVRHKTGQIVVVTVDAHTAYVKNRQPSAITGVEAGTRVTLELRSEAGGIKAVRVEMFGS